MAKLALVTGAAGLIGSEAVRFLAKKGFRIIGIDNNLRKYFFGPDGDTGWNRRKLQKEIPSYTHLNTDIRNDNAIKKIFKKNKFQIIIHAAAQPSHDWAAQEPFTDFTVNANGTLVMLENFRKYAPQATFIFTSTNKVYGDTPNFLPLRELKTRYEVKSSHPFYKKGIDESMSIDNSKHSIFGASKVAADIMVQEYGKYFGLNTAVFRGGCLTGPQHSGARLHGFLSYLVKCIALEKKYTIFGYKGKQVRDNIHSYDLVNCFWHFHKNPRPGEVYNMGGSRHSNVSIIEAVAKIEKIVGKKAQLEYKKENRIGDHIWYISDISKFRKHYPRWDFRYDIDSILGEICTTVLPS